MLFEIIDNTEEENKPGLIFFSDFEKAFDSIDHTHKINCLKHFNFGKDFIKWVKLFYNDAESCVTNNRYLSDFSPLCEAFVRDVPFPLISSSYVLNYFQIRLTTTEDIKGITYANYEFKKSLPTTHLLS